MPHVEFPKMLKLVKKSWSNKKKKTRTNRVTDKRNLQPFGGPSVIVMLNEPELQLSRHLPVYDTYTDFPLLATVILDGVCGVASDLSSYKAWFGRVVLVETNKFTVAHSTSVYNNREIEVLCLTFQFWYNACLLNVQ